MQDEMEREKGVDDDEMKMKRRVTKIYSCSCNS